MADRPHPRAVSIMVNKLAGWSHEVVYGTGTAEFGRRALVDGRGRLLREVLAVESVSVRAKHVDGRSFWAVWLRKDAEDSWSFDGAVRTWHVGEHEGLPQVMTARQAGAYAGAHDVASALAAVRAAAPKPKEEAA